MRYLLKGIVNVFLTIFSGEPTNWDFRGKCLQHQSVNRIARRSLQRSFSTATPSLYNASHRLKADVKADVRPEAIKKPHPKIASGITGIAQKLREKAPLMTETYVAYGATRDLIKECGRAAEYTIPQALDPKGEIPTDENGVHLGVGDGWWYESMHRLSMRGLLTD